MPLAAVLAVACFATRPVQAVPVLFTGMVNNPTQVLSYAIPFTPDAMFVGERSRAEVFAAERNVNLSDPAMTVAHGDDFSMMDTATHATSIVPDGPSVFAGALALLNNSTQLSGTVPFTVVGTADAASQLEWPVETPVSALTPVAGSAFLALGAVAALAVFRFHEGRGN
jgi:hypothetical protein